MRSRDLFGLALSALFQQKLRTGLTTLGVVFGSFVLVASLSVRRGVEDTILREYSKFGELRKIQVNPRYVERKREAPAAEPEVRGAMSDARRQRLRAELRQRRRQPQQTVAVTLTQERVAAIAALPHVRAVDAPLMQEARAFLGDRAENVVTFASPLEDEAFRKRLVAGSYLPAEGGRYAVVSEYLLYKLGVADEAAVGRFPGTKLRLESRNGNQPTGFLLTLLQGADRTATTGEERVLEKVLRRLPDAIDKLDLTDAEKAAARLLLRSPGGKGAGVAEEFTVCGVLRSAEPGHLTKRWEGVHRTVDVLLPPKIAEEMFFRVPRHRTEGYPYVGVEVDATANVKEVNQKLQAMGLRTHALAELIDREQFTYRLIFSAMSVIAVVSLLVAALGITNTMLMGVLERVREIGVMKAVGARAGHIQLIFLVEGALVGLAGGLLGLLLGWAASFPGDAWVRSTVESGLSIKLQESVFAFPWWLLLGVPLFACLTTTLAAFYPARRASRVDPVTALRHD